MTDTAVVVVSYNTRELTLRALASARDATDGLDAVIIAADNGSADGTCAAVRAAFPDVVLLESPDNPGYGIAINRAAAAHPAVYLCAMNADVILARASLRTLRAYLAGHAECGLVGPALIYPDGTAQRSCKRFPTIGLALTELLGVHSLLPENRWVRDFYYADRDLTRERPVDCVSGAVMMIRAQAFARVGGFDQRFRMYFEETDLCRRFSAAGIGVSFCPGARAVHHLGASTLQTSARQVEYYVSYIRYFRKHHGRTAPAALTLAVVLSTLGRMAGLPVKYPPLDRRRAALLRAKEGACARLLRALGPSATSGTPGPA